MLIAILSHYYHISRVQERRNTKLLLSKTENELTVPENKDCFQMFLFLVRFFVFLSWCHHIWEIETLCISEKWERVLGRVAWPGDGGQFRLKNVLISAFLRDLIIDEIKGRNCFSKMKHLNCVQSQNAKIKTAKKLWWTIGKRLASNLL